MMARMQSESQGISVYVNEQLVEDFDEWVEQSAYGNRSDALRSLMRSAAEADPDIGTPLAPPSDERLADHYRSLCKAARPNGVVPDETARRVCSGGSEGLSKSEVRDLVLRPLHKAGYIRSLANVYGDRSWVIQGWDR